MSRPRNEKDKIRTSVTTGKIEGKRSRCWQRITCEMEDVNRLRLQQTPQPMMINCEDASVSTFTPSFSILKIVSASFKAST